MKSVSRFSVPRLNVARDPARGSIRRAVLAVILVLTAGPIAAYGASLIAKGQPAPELSLTSLTGKTMRLSELRGQIVLLLFGELYNPNTVAAEKDLSEVLARPEMADFKVAAYLIITQNAPATDLLAEAKKKGVRLPILHDPDRQGFAAYRVTVLPSLVAIDPAGTGILSCAGYPLDFQDLVADTLLLSAGQLSSSEYTQRRATTTMATKPEAQVRAVRLTALGDQLVKRGSIELAISNYEKALDLDPNCIPARLGLGTCLLNRGILAEAEENFRHILDIQPQSVDASIGLVHIQVIRGGKEVATAEKNVRDLLRRRPNDPKVVYLAGLVEEKAGHADAALGHYRRSAELLLYGQPSRRDIK